MLNSLKKSIPFTIKAIPETKIEGSGFQNTLIAASHLLTVLSLMYVHLFQIITQPMFQRLNFYLACMEMSKKVKTLLITHPIQPNISICFFDPVHLLKNIRSNLFNSQRFILPSFQFDQIFDPIDVTGRNNLEIAS